MEIKQSKFIPGEKIRVLRMGRLATVVSVEGDAALVRFLDKSEAVIPTRWIEEKK